MVDRDQLHRSRAIQRRTGRTFYFATRLLPKDIRHATYVLYAFFRIADEVVDDPDPPPPSVQLTTLDRIRREALGERPPSDPVLAAFSELRDEHGIPDREVELFMSAMERDVSATRYETYEDLEGYLRGSSVAVGYMMVDVMEPADPETARPHAKALGEAFQLTNFLRDVREDVVEYGRIYLPRSTLDRHGVSDEQIERLEFSDGFAAAMRAELERTEALYRKGVDGIAYLPDDCQFAVLLAAVLYADHHRLIRDQGYDVLSNRPRPRLHRRVVLLVQTWWHWRRSGDPRATFDAVSAVPLKPAGRERGGGVDGARDHGSDGGRWAPPVRRIAGAIRSKIPLGGGDGSDV